MHWLRKSSTVVLHCQQSLSIPSHVHLASADSPAAGASAASDILSKKVYGEFVVVSLRSVEAKHSLSLEHPEYLSLMRMNVSRAAETQGRAVLEDLGLDQATITRCFQDNPLNYEEAVQSGLVKWSDGNAKTSPTWSVLLKAMEVAGIAKKYTENLKRSLGLSV